MSNIKKITVGSTAYDVEDTTARTSASEKVADVKLNGTTIVDASKAALLETIDNVTSTSQSPLSANQGKLLNDRINNLETIGRFLALWNSGTGLPKTNPPALPYTYKTGDYYIIADVVTGTNYMPNGTTYDGTASTTVSVPASPVNGDIWRFDGTVWSFESNHSSASGVQDVTVAGTSVVSGGVAVIPQASQSYTGVLSNTDWTAFNNKQDKIAAGVSGNVMSFSGTAGTINSIPVDSIVTESSTNLITSGGVYTKVASITPSVDSSGNLKFG